MKWFGESEILAKAGMPVRRRAWLADGGTVLKRIVYVAGAGTTRAVAVQRITSEDVVTPAMFGSADFLADDWEVA